MSIDPPVAHSAAEAVRDASADGGRVFLDVHFRHGEHDCEEIYLSGHVPGAHFFPLQHYSTHPDGLPPITEFEDEVRGWGVSSSTAVTVYGGRSWRSVARAWWLLRWAGLRDVSFLSGGLAAWIEEGGSLELGPVHAARGTATLWPGGQPTVRADDLLSLPHDTVLIDARDARSFRGEHGSPALSRAVNAPAGLNLDDGVLLDAEDLAAYYGRLGIDESSRVVVYSETGFSGALTVLALAAIGIRAALYPGRLDEVHARVGV
ncbi:sulfurtransferase [Agromyces intestinalis]|uniref:Sulfurtransferase n=1 Tax=Agromyces intestinalis TaxID=2592652 RepID=A0A5C1YFH2_9MICO|nr:rhodanese-like domain-containing protein [Agromyces intestinalis]QEO14834.1 sulfurtransferase [Agromyces intestinalis]